MGEGPAIAAGASLVVVAHPDDEAVSASALLARLAGRCVLITATDGAPRAKWLRPRDGRTREELAAVRRREQLAAAAVAGLRARQCVRLGLVDQEAATHLVELTRLLHRWMVQVRPARVFTHAFEGGHPDHDATAFAVHHAALLLGDSGAPAPAIHELASYRWHGKRLRSFEFLAAGGAPIKTVTLTSAERERKRRMYACHRSQDLSEFPIGIERLRRAPRYDFTRPVPGMPRWYRWSALGPGPRWFCQLAAEAMARLSEGRRPGP